MRRVLKILGWTLAGLGVILVAVVVIAALIPDQQYREWLTAGIRSATGRNFEIGEDFDVRIGSTLGLTANDIRLPNADWGSKPNLFTASRLEADIAIWPLLKGVADVSFQLEQPNVFLETNASGIGNWEFGEPAADTGVQDEEAGADDARGGLPIKPYIRKFHVNGLEFAMRDGASGSRLEAGMEKLHLGVVDEVLALDVVGHYNGAPVILAGNLGRNDDLLDNAQTPVKLAGKIGDSTLTLSGKLGPLMPTPTVDLEVNLQADSVAALGPFAGQNLPDLRGLMLSARLVGADGRFAVDDAKASLRDAALSVALEGTVSDLAAVSGIDVRAEVISEDPKGLAAKLGITAAPDLAGSIKVEASAKGSLEKLSVPELRAAIHAAGMDIDIAGAAENVMKPVGVAADVSANVRSVAELARLAGMELPELGRLDLKGRVETEGEAVKLEFLTVNLSEGGLDASLRAAVANLLALANFADADKGLEGAGIDVELAATVPSVSAMSAIAGVDLPELGVVDLKSRLSSEGKRVRLDALDLTLAGTVVNAAVRGSAADLLVFADPDRAMESLSRAGISVDLNADAPSIAGLAQIAGADVPELGKLRVQGRVASAADALRVESLTVSVEGEALDAKVAATVANLMALAEGAEFPDAMGAAGVALELNAAVSSLAELSQVAGADLPDIGKVDVAGRIASVGGALALESLDVDVAGDVLEAELRATIADLMALRGIQADRAALGHAGVGADVTARIPSIAGLAGKADVTVPEIGALDLSGKIAGKGGALQLESLTATLSGDGYGAQIEAAVADLLTVTGVNATVDARIDSLAAVSELAGIAMPATGAWTVAANVAAEQGVSGPTSFHARLAGEGMKANFEAHIPDLRDPTTLNAEMLVEAPSIAAVSQLAGRQLPEAGPLRIGGKVNAVPGEFRADDLLIALGDGSFSGNVAYTAPPANGAGRPRLSGRFDVRDFDLTPLLPQDAAPTEDTESTEEEAAAESEEAAAAGASGSGPKKLFSQEPLPLERLRNFDVDIAFTGRNIRASELEISQADGALTLTNGLLQFGRFSTEGPRRGKTHTFVILDASKTVPTLEVHIDVEDIVVPSGGDLDAEIGLTGAGRSIGELMGGLNGRVVVAVSSVPLEKSFMTQFGSGFLHQMNPFKSEDTMLECAVVRLDIEDGQVDFKDKIVAKLTDLTWFASGEIDLKTEELDVQAKPASRRPISSLTNIGLAGLVHVGGTLAEPKIQLDLVDVAKKYASYTAAVATGGLSFLGQKVFEGIKVRADKCARLLKGSALEGELGKK